jgi:peroxiredoxin
MRLTRFAVGGLLLLALSQHEAARADSAKPEDVIRKMCDFYKVQKSFSVSSETEFQIHAPGMNNTSRSSFELIFERPNHVALRGKGSPGLNIVSDGKNLYTFVAALKKYTKKDAPQTLNQLAEDPVLTVGAPGTTNFVVDFLGDDPAKPVLKVMATAKDLGLTKVDGQSARHLQFTQGDIDCDVWIADAKDPLLLRVDYDLSKMVKKNGGLGKDIKLTMSQTLKNWKFDITPGPKEFSFTPPKNAKEVPSLFGRSEEELSPLLGKAAPPVDLERLDGKRVKLADHSGKEVVMLDMWATWCGPCRKELPYLIEVAKDYKDKGVVFYAVNLRETKKKIEDFLKKEKLEMKIALDPEGKVGEAYGAEAIPLLVLVDKHGIVQSVHVGYSPGIKEELHKELDGILAGKNLAAATIAEHNAKKKASEKAKDKLKKDKDKKPSNEQTAR